MTPYVDDQALKDRRKQFSGFCQYDNNSFWSVCQKSIETINYHYELAAVMINAYFPDRNYS